MSERKGVWRATPPPLRPETDWYWFIVDGGMELDPFNDYVLPNYVYLNRNVTVRGHLYTCTRQYRAFFRRPAAVSFHLRSWSEAGDGRF
jgi:hypothetical protein